LSEEGAVTLGEVSSGAPAGVSGGSVFTPAQAVMKRSAAGSMIFFRNDMNL
jgi:hypothetical protein